MDLGISETYRTGIENFNFGGCGTKLQLWNAHCGIFNLICICCISLAVSLSIDRIYRICLLQ